MKIHSHSAFFMSVSSPFMSGKLEIKVAARSEVHSIALGPFYFILIFLSSFVLFNLPT